uniref:Ribosomal protein S18 n=1 Tax=Globodera pallida TaxID=36090 RepID=A0A183C982_GLOPA
MAFRYSEAIFITIQLFNFFLLTNAMNMHDFLWASAVRPAQSSQNSALTDTLSYETNKSPAKLLMTVPFKRAFDRLDVSNFDFNKRFMEVLDVAPPPRSKLLFNIHRMPSELPNKRKLAEGLKRRRWAMQAKQQLQAAGRGPTVSRVLGFGLSFGGMRRLRRTMLK